nr:glycosyltransferase family A protein [Rubellimicrobium aerolatum]
MAAPGPAPGSAGRDGPRVTVLMAAYEAAATIGTALRSLRAQTWADLEILVLDDASPTDAMARVVRAHAAEDPRIRLIRLERNGGAYIARNRGLDEATGELVTIHDADDWSHPAKIETQARFLLETPRVMGCTSEQARVLDDLSFRKLRGGGGFVTFNTSSFLFRRAPVREALGYWDTVRFGADNELIRRVQRVWGGGAFRKLPTGPLSFQRDAATSVTGDAVKGIDGGFHYYGVRRDYFDAQRHHHVHARSLRYSGRPGERPFGVAPMMLPHPPDPVPRRFDAVFVGEFRLATPAVLALAAEIAARRARGEVLGLVEAYDYRLDLPANAGMCAELRALVDGATVRALVYGEEAVTARLVPVGRPTPLDRLRFVPRIVVEAEGDAGPAAR